MQRRRLVGRLLPCALFFLLLFAAGVFLAVKLPSALAPIAAGERLLSLCAALFVMARAPAENRESRLILLLIPWLGAILCFFLRGRTVRAPKPCAPFGDGMANAVASLAAAGGLCGGFAESTTYFPTGKEMSERLLADLAAAKSEILLDYYILAHGKFFGNVLEILRQKAGEGVQVRLVCDGFGCAGLSRKFLRRLNACGIAATVFGPLRPLSLFRLNRRDHRKIAVIDRRIAYTGGVNLADEYIGETIRYGHWKDTAVRVEGGVAGQFAKLFGLKEPSPAKTGGILCVPFADGADGGYSARTGEEILLRLISSAERSLELCTPYLVPTERVLAALKGAALAGVRVRLLLPHIPDKKTVLLLSRGYAAQLAAAGVETREYAPGFLHAKSVTADGKYAVIGSYNLDRRSLRLQAECGLFVADETFAAAAVRDFDEIWRTGIAPPRETFWKKLAQTALLPFVQWV